MHDISFPFALRASLDSAHVEPKPPSGATRGEPPYYRKLFLFLSQSFFSPSHLSHSQ